ncbi:type II toxin-antitoxin system VapC family toxin [Sphaerisporangium sp. NPDC088356]|uniref:type II toxin-antitoxin system VapC family toxin n=1 Tax=Sphaerisporangium sp. NPDC088356 TaxID=3154871 RepID=UPI003432ED3B
MTTGYLLDTNVVSETRKREPDTQVMEWVESVHGPSLYLSTLVVGEVRYGAERLRRRDSRQAEFIDAWLDALYRDFRDRIIPVTSEVAEEWGRLRATSPLPAVDGLLAATALVRGWTLVTRNVKDVADTGVRLVNPFEPLV